MHVILYLIIRCDKITKGKTIQMSVNEMDLSNIVNNEQTPYFLVFI